MKQNETINGIEVVNTLNSDIIRKENINQVPIQNIFKRDKIRINRNSFQNLVSKKNITQIKSKKKLMSKEQRTILKSFLKENAKKNRKSVAKNLIGFFVESSKNSQKFQFNNKEILNTFKRMESMKGITRTPKPKLFFHKKKEKERETQSVNKEKIKKKSTVDIRPSMFKSAFKNRNNKKEETKKSNKELNIKMINFDNNVIKEEDDYTSIAEFNKNMNFTNLFKLQQNINEITDINTATRFYTPKRLGENPLKLNFEMDHKKSMVFQIKSFRDFVEDNIIKDFDECRRFLNNTSLISHLNDFLLELGNGFAFVARQRRFDMDGRNFYVDLVLYNYKLKCFVLIDLKMGDLTHQDIGQMQMYVNYYTRELMEPGDNPPIGIILSADKSDTLVKYTLPLDNKQIYASKYMLYLPKEEDLQKEMNKQLKLLNDSDIENNE